MLLSVLNLTDPGVFSPGVALHVIAVAFLNGNTETSGEINVTSNDPLEENICIIVMSRKHYYCNVRFPNAGAWTVAARYRPTTSGPTKYLAAKSLRVTIQSAVTTTTEVQIYDQATATTFGPDAFNQVIVGEYYPNEEAGVVTAGSNGTEFPGAGTITFVDAAGHTICSATVVADLIVGCTGSPSSMPPPNPVTAYYSGTQYGLDDGHGTSYAPSSAAEYVPSY